MLLATRVTLYGWEEGLTGSLDPRCLWSEVDWCLARRHAVIFARGRMVGSRGRGGVGGQRRCLGKDIAGAVGVGPDLESRINRPPITCDGRAMLGTLIRNSTPDFQTDR